jgi:hypothetical protein
MLMVKNQDLASKLEKSQNKTQTVQKMHPKMKVGFLHAALNDACVAGSVYSWWTRSSQPNYAPDDIALIISGVSFLALNLSGYLGAVMVYDHGVGVARVAKGSKAL